MKFLQLKLVILLGVLLLTTTIQAATPVVNTSINISKTGSEPFDAGSWDGNDLTLAGQDKDEDNNIVRMQDSVTYKVEISVNDAAVDNLVATVLLPDGKQKWIQLPTGCETDANFFTPVSSISDDGYTLTCNVGKGVEGTSKVFYPAAKVVSYNEVENKPVLNDERTIARVSATAAGAIEAKAGDTEVIITAGFKVDTVKTMKVAGLDKDGKPLYKSTIAKGPNGEAGYVLEYKIFLKYAKGSMLMDAPNEAGGDYKVNINLFDIYTNDNPNSTGTAGNSSGGILYTWGKDGTSGGCSLDGEHGAGAAVTCASTNFDIATGAGSTTAAFDGISPTNPAVNVTDGVVDPNIEIALSNIDVRDPDSDGNVVELNIVVWYSKTDDIANCDTGTPCAVFTVNAVGILNGTSIEGYNPVSTEDANGNKLLNYAGTGEPTPNEIDYPLIASRTGSWGAGKIFGGFYRTTGADNWTPDLEVSAGQIIQMGTYIDDHRANDDVGQSCDKIDTTQFEFLGLYDPASGEDTIRERAYWGDYYPEANFNPRVNIYGGGHGFVENTFDLPATYTILYSKVPVLAAGATTPEQDYLEALRISKCADDVDGDGQVRIKLKDGKVYDKTIGGSEVTDGGAIDWYESTAHSVSGIDGDIQGQVTRVRQEFRTDNTLFPTLTPGYLNTRMGAAFDLKIKGDATGYGPSHFLPNYMNVKPRLSSSTSYSAPENTTDVNNIAFSKRIYIADRVKLVKSSIGIKKVTEPKGIKVVKAGDYVDFIITPGIFGLWTDEETATVSDAVPAGTAYVAGSEKFSLDGGATWLSYDAYQALANAEATLTSSANAAGANPLVWEFGALTAKSTGSDTLPLIKYTVKVDPTTTSASYTNTATLTSNIDNDGGNSPVKAIYNIKVLPSQGFELLKTVDQAVYNTNTEFDFKLTYKNLGGESYNGSQFIDILPHNADGTGVSSGLASARTPASTYNGSYTISALTGTNSETFEMTSADPTTIPQDPCHEDNLPSGYVPSTGDLCYNYYISSNTAGTPVKVANTFAGGATAGTGKIVWMPFVADTVGTTAIRFNVNSIAASAGAKTVTMTVKPSGNKGGAAVLDNFGKVTSDSTGDIYTNTFGGRVSEISLVIISNDVSVTVVSGSIGDYVWSDENNDGIQDASELPLVNVTLKLLDGAGNPIYVDANGTVVPAGTQNAVAYTVQTDSTGKYLFSNLTEGDYKVEVDSTTLPADAVQTYDADGLTTGNTSNVTLATQVDPQTGEKTSVEANLDQDFGYNVPKGSLSGHVNHELSDNTLAGIPGVTLTLHHADGTAVLDANNQAVTTVTNASGEYVFADLIPGDYIVREQQPQGFFDVRENEGGLDDDNTTATGVNEISARVGSGETDVDNDFVEAKSASLGNLVWYDMNEDGIQDAGENGVESVRVYLLDATGARVKLNGADVFTDTNSSGEYIFNGLNPLEEYAVEFDLATLPSGYKVTLEGEGIEEQDSDGNAETGKTEMVSLNAGELNPNLDLGIYSSSAHIGDYFWIDLNANGIQDAGEEPVVGAKVELFDAEGNPVSDANGNQVVTTDSNGKYGFDVEPGTYKVKFNLPTTGYEGYVFSSANKGDDATDTDVNGKGFTQTVAVKAGDNILTLDAGVNCGCSNVSSDSSDTLGFLGMLSMMLLTLMAGLFFVRKEERLHV